MFDLITVDADRTTGLTRITLSRPDVRNTLNHALRQELTRAFRIASADPTTRVITLEARGAAFCLGHDFAAEPPNSPEEVTDTLLIDYAPLLEAIEAAPVPVIAAVSGPAVGVGVSLALACDLVLVQERAFFSMPFAQRGLIPDAGCFDLVADQAGARFAFGAALLETRIAAEEAVRRGLAWECLPRHGLETRLLEVAQQIAVLPPRAVRNLKRLKRGHGKEDASARLVSEAEMQADCVRGRMQSGQSEIPCATARMSPLNEVDPRPSSEIHATAKRHAQA